MLRLYLRTRPAARGALQKTVGFGGASYISLSLSTPIKIGEKSSSTMAAQDEQSGELRTKTQQSPLASQRPADGQAPGRIAKWFPLSASDGFSQWVCSDSL
jgi:cardiolipin-specific phospholipase